MGWLLSWASGLEVVFGVFRKETGQSWEPSLARAVSPKGVGSWQLKVPTSLLPAPPALHLPGPPQGLVLEGSALRKSCPCQRGGGSVGFWKWILREGCSPEGRLKVTSLLSRDFI